MPGRTLGRTDRGCGRREVVTKRCVLKSDPNPQQDRGGDWQRVYRKRQFDQTALCSAPELAVLPINVAPARVDLFCVDDNLVNQRHDVKDRSSSTYTSGIATIYSPSSDRGNSTVFPRAAASLSQARCQDAAEGCNSTCGTFLEIRRTLPAHRCFTRTVKVTISIAHDSYRMSIRTTVHRYSNASQESTRLSRRGRWVAAQKAS